MGKFSRSQRPVRDHGGSHDQVRNRAGPPCGDGAGRTGSVAADDLGAVPTGGRTEAGERPRCNGVGVHCEASERNVPDRDARARRTTRPFHQGAAESNGGHPESSGPPARNSRAFLRIFPDAQVNAESSLKPQESNAEVVSLRFINATGRAPRGGVRPESIVFRSRAKRADQRRKPTMSLTASITGRAIAEARAPPSFSTPSM